MLKCIGGRRVRKPETQFRNRPIAVPVHPMALKQLETVVAQKCGRWIDSRPRVEMGILHNLSGDDAGDLIFCVQRSVQARESRADRCRRKRREIRNDLRKVLQAE